MICKFHKNFDKNYQKLSSKFQNKVDETLYKFQLNPWDPILKNHTLHGSLTGKRAIKVTGDIRIIFEEFKDYTIVLFLDIGTHNQVY